MNEFMILVERTVRPVVAGPNKKLRMREELLAHLQGVYEQELTRMGDEQLARFEAMRRFGEPATLTQELQASTTGWDRWDFRLNKIFGWRTGESAVRHSVRLAGLMAIAILGVIAIVIALASTNQKPTGLSTGMMLRFCSLLLILSCGMVFVTSLLGIWIRDAYLGAFGQPRSLRKVCLYCAMLYTMLPTVTILMEAILVPDLLQMMERQTSMAVFASALAYVFVPIWVILHVRKSGASEIRHVEWASLEIGQ